MTVHDDLKAVLDQRAVLGLKIPTFDVDSLPEPIADRWLQSMTSDLARDELVRRLVMEQHSS